ncbi:MAG: hypothetical protein A3F11_11680 [Gammaproteobacteria bacterium RIFCSPHIGHO2_12_FULL_37_14]|nr:MAG: hypothetical protein A3F11_11680 [Gammaproteobacteria bacterium RIFCSPHIGHO2_12_FULL_37_14]
MFSKNPQKLERLKAFQKDLADRFGLDEKSPDGCDLSLMSLNNGEELSTISPAILEKAQQTNTPILMRKNESEFFVYGDKNGDGKWDYTKITVKDSDLTKLPFEKGIIKRSDKTFTPSLINILEEGHIPLDYGILKNVISNLIQEDLDEEKDQAEEKLYPIRTKREIYNLFEGQKIAALVGYLVGENSQITNEILSLDEGRFIKQSLMELAYYMWIHGGEKSSMKSVTTEDLKKIFKDKFEYAKYVLDNCDLIVKGSGTYSFISLNFQAYMNANHTIWKTNQLKR